MIEAEFPDIWVRGEVIGCKAYPSGHWYFILRDAESQVRCCMWKLYAQRAGKPPADGTEVFVLGRPAIYGAKGEFQLVVTRMLPTAAVGAAQQELERVKLLLQKDGLFDPARKRPLPPYAATVAVVTSVAGAALRDIITVSRKRWPSARLLVVGARVQGEGAVDELCRALRLVNRLAGVDLCIVGAAAAAGRPRGLQHRSGLPRARRGQSPHHLRRRARDRHLPHRSRRRRAGRHAVRRGGAGLGRHSSSACGRLDDLAARLAGGLSGRARLAAERAGAHRRPSPDRRTNPSSSADAITSLVSRRSSTR